MKSRLRPFGEMIIKIKNWVNIGRSWIPMSSELVVALGVAAGLQSGTYGLLSVMFVAAPLFAFIGWCLIRVGAVAFESEYVSHLNPVLVRIERGVENGKLIS